MQELPSTLFDKVSTAQVMATIEAAQTIAQVIKDLNTVGGLIGIAVFEANYPNPLGQMHFER